MFVVRTNQLRTAGLRFARSRFPTRCSSSAQTEPTKYDDTSKGELGSVKKSKKPPFLKGVLAGVYDDDMLVYPEVVDVEELQQRVTQTIRLEPANSGEPGDSVTSSSVQSRVKSLFKANVPMTSSECSDSERVKMYELLDADLQTALLMETQSLVIDVISKYGSEKLKSKYLKKLESGELTGAFALSEASSGSDPSSIETIAEYDLSSEGHFITGTKNWVTNGKEADVILVFALSLNPHRADTKEVSVFLVEKNSPGLKYSEQLPHELQECGLVNIQFKETPVPAENEIGELGNGFEIGSMGITHSRYFVMTSLLNRMKKSLKEVHDYVKVRKQLPLPLKDCELIQYKLSQVGSLIYGLESALYLFTGMRDSYEMDTTVESAALQLYCYDSAQEAMKICNEILGGSSYDGSSHHMKLLSEVQGVVLASKTSSLLQLYISLCSLQYAAFKTHEIVKMNRNPLDFPGFVFKQMIQNSKQQKDSPTLDLQLYMNLHPSLKTSADILEYSVLRLKFAVQTLLNRYGKDAVNKQMDLCRIAKVVTDVFIMTAVLGRASRSYCTGIRYCDQEMLFANAFCLDAHHRVRLNVAQIVDGGVISNDIGRLKIGTEIINLGGYFLEHPLVKNIK